MRFPRFRTTVFGLVALAAMALAGPAHAAIAPDVAHSPNAEDQRIAFWVMLALATLIVLALAGGLLMAVRRFRSTGTADEPRRLTAGRGVIAKAGAGLGMLVLVVFIFGVVVSSGVKNATAEEGAEEIEINAIAQQWLWRFEYPVQAEGNFSEGISTVFSYNELVVPVDTLVHLNIDSTDVIHSWSVPALGPQVWAVPGSVAEASFIADAEGVYRGRSMVYSGSAFPFMRTTVRVVSQDEYETFLDDLTANLQAGQEAVQEEALAEEAAEDANPDDGAEETTTEETEDEPTAEEGG
ncbi:MAG TPA: cytochrome c oxidase subunit II [Solirubrobacterales bacterium]|nr:cytochrome c oxidase subunit II [Solirubrobacterales bacterium]